MWSPKGPSMRQGSWPGPQSLPGPRSRLPPVHRRSVGDLHLTITFSGPVPMRKPVNMDSSRMGGKRGAGRERPRPGGRPGPRPRGDACPVGLGRVGSGPPLPCACASACRSVVRPMRCMRYMPEFWRPVSGSLVITWGRVMKGPPSSGQQVRMGSRSRLASSMP